MALKRLRLRRWIALIVLALLLFSSFGGEFLGKSVAFAEGEETGGLSPEEIEVVFDEEKSDSPLPKVKLKSNANEAKRGSDEEPSFNAYVYLIQDDWNDETGDEDKYFYGDKDSPAIIDYMDMVLGGGYWANYLIEYENLCIHDSIWSSSFIPYPCESEKE